MTRRTLGATWMDDESAAYSTATGTVHGSNRRAMVECPDEDGTLRTATVGIADTFYSIPAYVWRNRRRIHGYVTIRTEDDLDSGEPLAFVFMERQS